MREFSRIVHNEWIKLIRRRRFVIVLLLGLILVGFYSYATYRHTQRELHYADPVVQKQMMDQRIQDLQTQLKANSISQEKKDNINKQLEQIKQDENNLGNQNASTGVFDEAAAKKTIENLKKDIANLSDTQAVEKGDLQSNLKLAEYTLEHKLVVKHSRAGTAWENIKQFLDVGTQVFIPLLCVLLVADMVSGEQTGGTIKLLLTRPASRVKILFAKYVTSIIGAFFIIAILLLVLTGLLFMIFGTAGGTDPVIVGVKYSQVTEMMRGQMSTMVAADPSQAMIIPMQSFIIQSLLLTLLATVAMVTLGFFCSVLVRSAAVSTGVSMAVIIIGTIVVHIAQGNAWIKFFLTPHFGLPFAWTGELSQQFGYSMSLAFSLSVLLGWTLVMYAYAHYLFKKRDILS